MDLVSLKKAVRKAVSLCMRDTKNNYAPYYNKVVYFDFVDGAIVATGHDGYSIAVISAPYLRGMSEKNFALSRKDAVTLTKASRIEILEDGFMIDAVKRDSIDKYPNYRRVLDDLVEENGFIFNKKELVQKLSKIASEETFKMNIDADNRSVKIVSASDTEDIYCEELSWLHLRNQELCFKTAMVVKGLKALEDKKLIFVFDEHRAKMISSSLTYMMLAERGGVR